MEVDDANALTVADPQRILGEQLRLHPIHIIIIIITIFITY
jgi:hypothetical protein